MAFINEHYRKLRGGYLFREIASRVKDFGAANPRAAQRIIHCGIGDVSEPLPPVAVEAMHRAVDDLADRETFRGYGPPSGYAFLRDAIARAEFEDRGLEMSPDEIFVSEGSKGDCGAILDILGQNNRIGVSDPVYPAYVDTNVMSGRTGPAAAGGGYEGLVYLPCTATNDFVPALPDVRLDVIYLCYPNNPTGAMISRSRLAEWVDYALANEAIILYDVAYQAFVREPDRPRSIYEIDGARRCAIEFHSFSKNGGFTGVRCGFTVCPKDLVGTTPDAEHVALHELWTRRWNTRSNGICYVVQRAAEALYTEDGRRQVEALVDHYLANARILREGCKALGLSVYGGVNAPYVWVACPEGVSSWQMFDRLLHDANVVVTPGIGFGRCGEGYVRISAFNTRENVEEAVRRMDVLRHEGKKVTE